MHHVKSPSPAEMYEQYFSPAIFRPWARVLLAHAMPQPGERVLDLACATGSVARQVAPIVGTEGKVVALDINPNMIAVARALPAPEGAPIEWQEGNAIALELPDDTFDLVLCQQGLQFFPDRAAALGEMRRVLTRGGRAVLSLWRSLDHHPLYKALTEAEVRHLGPLGVSPADASKLFSMGDAGEIRTLLEDARFQRIEIVQKSLDVHFPSPDHFVEKTQLAYAAVIPEFAQNPAAFSAFIERISHEAAPLIERYRNGDKLTFAMSAHIAIAYR